MIQPGCPWQVALHIVTVNTGDANHNRLVGRFGDAVEGVKGVLLQRLYLLESLLSQASEWSRTYSASPCGSHTTAAALAGRNALVTDVDTLRDRLRRLSVEGLCCGSGVNS